MQAHEYRGERCGVLSSYRADAAVARQASQTAGENSPYAILEVQAHVALLQQALSLAGSHEEGAADALWAEGLKVETLAVSLAAAAVEQAHSQGVEVVGVLRAALVRAAPGLGKAAHCEEAEARHAALEDVEQHALEALAVGGARHFRPADRVMVRSVDALCTSSRSVTARRVLPALRTSRSTECRALMEHCDCAHAAIRQRSSQADRRAPQRVHCSNSQRACARAQ